MNVLLQNPCGFDRRMNLFGKGSLSEFTDNNWHRLGVLNRRDQKLNCARIKFIDKEARRALGRFDKVNESLQLSVKRYQAHKLILEKQLIRDGSCALTTKNNLVSLKPLIKEVMAEMEPKKRRKKRASYLVEKSRNLTNKKIQRNVERFATIDKYSQSLTVETASKTAQPEVTKPADDGRRPKMVGKLQTLVISHKSLPVSSFLPKLKVPSAKIGTVTTGGPYFKPVISSERCSNGLVLPPIDGNTTDCSKDTATERKEHRSSSS